MNHYAVMIFPILEKWGFINVFSYQLLKKKKIFEGKSKISQKAALLLLLRQAAGSVAPASCCLRLISLLST